MRDDVEALAEVLREEGFWATHADRWTDVAWQDRFWATLAGAVLTSPWLAAHVATARAEERERAVDLLTVLIADHPMWIGNDGQALDYLPEREARITDLCREFADALRALHQESE